MLVYRFMRENQGQYPIRELAGIFGVSCSAYYKGAKQQGVSLRREEEDGEWVRRIRELEEEEQYRYGSLRERDPLRRNYGKRVSRKKAARLMREPGLHAPGGGSAFPGPTRTPGYRWVRSCWTARFTPKRAGRNGFSRAWSCVLSGAGYT